MRYDLVILKAGSQVFATNGFDLIPEDHQLCRSEFHWFLKELEKVKGNGHT